MSIHDYKHEHEVFVAGHNGTTFTEIGALTSIPCIGSFTREIMLLFFMIGMTNRNKSISKRWRLFLDFFTLVIPSVFAVTFMSSWITHISVFLLILSLSAYYLVLQREKIDFEYVLQKGNLTDQKAFIVWYRSIVNLMTAIAILAVDFPVFPRRLAKSETYGFGGMDNGVGFFVIANAIVSPEARGKHYQKPILSQLKHCLSGCIPLLLLGLGRLAAVKGTDYHEHVTEYGVHWNFFFTLAALKLMSTLLYCVVSVDRSLLIGLAVTALHQLLLSKCGLSYYIMHGPQGAESRIGIVNANREGILSIPGYLAIYVLGVAMGQFLFEKRENLRMWLAASKLLFFTVLACTATMIVLHNHVEKVSRRLANATFVFWIVGNGCLMLLECLLAEIAVECVKWGRKHQHCLGKQSEDKLGTRSREDMTRPELRSTELITRTTACDTPEKQTANHTLKGKSIPNNDNVLSSVCLLDAVGYNALLFFLMANVMTGLVNMSMRTMYASNVTAVFVLTLYLFILCLVFVTLRMKNIRTKVW